MGSEITRIKWLTVQYENKFYGFSGELLT